ncbi:MAG: bacteriohemerythrin [Betaproteobacteria bacterium]|nr:bacteriohemerythrin [Betaproteobacteria bacterium]
MAHVVWSNDLSVGLDVIDKQHMRIVDYINELDEAVVSKRADRVERIMAIVDAAIDYTESHFGFEEVMLEEVGYPFIKAHKKVHELFVRRIVGYRDRLLAGEDIGIELRDTLGRWLINHIKNEDSDYSKWCKSSNVSLPPGLKQTGVGSSHEPEGGEGWLSSRLKRFFR